MYTSVIGSGFERPLTTSKAGVGTCTVIATAFLLSGTGSSYFVEDLPQWMEYVKPRVHQEFNLDGIDLRYGDTGANDVEVRTIAQHLENIRNVINPSMSELARDLGVTRQALYKWVSGEFLPEDKKNEQYILTLSRISDEFVKANVTDAKNLSKIKAFNGLTILDIVKNGGDWLEAVSTLIDESKARKSEADQVIGRETKAKSTDSWKSYVSIPSADVRD
ncbi:XRE family transcriptional regulator [Pantoea sp. ACRSH]|uniref:XRE family transcriptional regulator n=1 Tax=unclassified Pantoea TaxID=2630326 RepID=UPI001EF4391F|nr:MULTISPECIES: XRE family transcriptional regulator [unclassified Pantoea]MCG7368200.1 XRE family transcriptional regulator [Pantoea sp. ACRSH]MCG7398574.1 XRE family transcriptional regulator [Pantoea sp. ACRSC]